MKPRRSTVAKGAKLGARIHRPKRGKGSYRRTRRVDDTIAGYLAAGFREWARGGSLLLTNP